MTELIRLESVSKIYPRVQNAGERLRAFIQLLLGKEPKDGAQVLDTISLEVKRGESLGIIGENGAGKSTLLKVLTGIVKPTQGTVNCKARTAALLELGAGFQPDFSGIENVRMKAALLGMSRQDLEAKLDEILAFADIGDYIYEPVKHYSSGMVVRLGFAVVAASEPELLITDEVLAVGDESFQKKCVRWLEQFLKDGGTLLMVSHSMYQVQKLCKRALWIHHGAAEMYGDVFDVTQSYLGYHEKRAADEKQARDASAGQSGRYRVTALSFVDGSEHPRLDLGGDIAVEMIVYSPDGRVPGAFFGIVRADGTPVYGLPSEMDDVVPKALDEHHYRFVLTFNSPQLLPGSYNIRGHSMDPEGMRLTDTKELDFSIRGESRELGLVRLPHQWSGKD